MKGGIIFTIHNKKVLHAYPRSVCTSYREFTSPFGKPCCKQKASSFCRSSLNTRKNTYIGYRKQLQRSIGHSIKKKIQVISTTLPVFETVKNMAFPHPWLRVSGKLLLVLGTLIWIVFPLWNTHHFFLLFICFFYCFYSCKPPRATMEVDGLIILYKIYK